MTLPSDDEADEVEDEADGGRSREWLSWLLVAAAVLPPVVLAEVARRFLTGDAGASYFGTYVSVEDLRARLDLTFSVRFRLLWATVPVPDVLVATLPVVLALAAVVVAGRPDWLVPHRWGRRVASVAAALGAVESLICLVVLVDLTDEPPSDSFGNLQLTYSLPSTGGFPEVAPVLALLVVTTVVPAVAALVLWQAVEPVRAVEQETAQETVQETVRPEDVDARPDATEPEPEPERGEPETRERDRGHDVPRLTAEELDHYRRPGG